MKGKSFQGKLPPIEPDDEETVADGAMKKLSMEEIETDAMLHSSPASKASKAVPSAPTEDLAGKIDKSWGQVVQKRKLFIIFSFEKFDATCTWVGKTKVVSNRYPS